MNKVKDVFRKYPHLKGNTSPLGQIISLERYPLNEKFYDEVWKTENLKQDYFQMHENASVYQDKSISEIFDYFKDNSKDTIFFMIADHGNSDLISPQDKINKGVLQKNLIHVPLSIFSFDEKISKKYDNSTLLVKKSKFGQFCFDLIYQLVNIAMLL